MSNVENAIKKIRESGFDHIKIELEAEVQYDGETTRGCEECEESGTLLCWYCDGDGQISEDGQFTECEHCRGTGRSMCEECAGSGEVEVDLNSGEMLIDLTREYETRARQILGDGNLTYIRGYCDGSVNTEITLTIPLSQATKLEALIALFHDVCNEFGGYETENAGMHITIMNGSSFPTNRTLPSQKIHNFTVAMQSFVKYMYPLATDGSTYTRSMHYRAPACSSTQKYSAIYTHRETCIEYRIFDTCYHRPSRVNLFLSVIAKSLTFYRDKLTTSQEALRQSLRQGFINTTDDDGCQLRYAYDPTPTTLIKKGVGIFCDASIRRAAAKHLKVNASYQDKQKALEIMASH